MRSKLLVLASLLILASMVLSACQPSATPTPEVIIQTQIVEGEPQEVVVTATPSADQPAAAAPYLRVNLGTYPDTIDPQKSSFVNEIAHLKLIYEGLTRLDNDLNTVPGAAESWEYNDDATQLTFHLREGLKYSDGSLLNAKRFEYSLMRNIDPATAGEYASITDDIAGAADWRTADVTALHNVVTSCNRAGLNVAEIVLESVASSLTVLGRDEMELGVALIDIGGGTTDLAIFCNGTIKHTWELALGGNNLTSDLSVGLRTPLQEAEELKYLYGGALSSMIKENHIIEVPTVGDRKPRKVSQRIMVEILEARMEEILQMVNKNICASGYRNRINAGIVITGGTALLANIVEMAEQVFDLPVRIGYPQGVTGRIEDVRSPRCTTAVGLVLHGSKAKTYVPKESGGMVSKLKNWVKNIV